jgi:CDP-paratose 2-epimerase
VRREAERPTLTLITGGAGFIGCNVADRLATMGERVLIYDNLSRKGAERNAAWLQRRHGELIEIENGDVRDGARLRRAVARARHVFHFAAQVAVTTSLGDPINDFEVNARGTLNVLAAIRECAAPPSLLYTSTNKVYGALDDITCDSGAGQFVPADIAIREAGIDERRPLDFYSPYGCSKGCADQYVLDHARIYGLRATVFRMSCIYGPHQLGTEDQGWVAHFALRALAGQPITVYGNGLQVRDALYVDDLVQAFLLARAALQEQREAVTGRAFNIGGGTANAVSLLAVVERITAFLGRRPELKFGPWRPGDQRYYVSDTSAFRRATGWAPATAFDIGLGRLIEELGAPRIDGGSLPGVSETDARVEPGSP